MDKAVHSLPDEMFGRMLDVQDDQSTKKLQREDDDQQDDIDDDQVHITIKSFYSWKSRPKITIICNDEIILFI